jgi:hypothetical protein
VFQQVTLTEAEQRALRERADELGVSVPRLLVESALSTQGETATERRAMIAEMFEVRRLVATVANNVTQLAKAANIGGQVAEREQLQATLGEVDELLGRLRDLTGARPVRLLLATAIGTSSWASVARASLATSSESPDVKLALEGQARHGCNPQLLSPHRVTFAHNRPSDPVIESRFCPKT